MKHSWLADIDFDKLLKHEIKPTYIPEVDEIDVEEEEDRSKIY